MKGFAHKGLMQGMIRMKIQEALIFGRQGV